MEVLKHHKFIIILISTIFICMGVFYLLWNSQQPGRMGQAPAVSGFKKLVFNQANAASTESTNRSDENNKKSLKLSSDTFMPKSLIVSPTNEYGQNDPGRPAKTGETVISDAAKQLTASDKTVVTDKNAASVKAAASDKASTSNQTATTELPSPITLFFTRTALLPKEKQDEATKTYTVSKEELLLLEKIVMAEAEGEPYKGKVAVANVVLNRLRSANYPNTIHDVIYEKHQFSPVANGRLKRVQPNEDSCKAVAEALNGRKEVSDNTYYFLSLKLATDLSIHYEKKKAKTIGNHTFYTDK